MAGTATAATLTLLYSDSTLLMKIMMTATAAATPLPSGRRTLSCRLRKKCNLNQLEIFQALRLVFRVQGLGTPPLRTGRTMQQSNGQTSRWHLRQVRQWTPAHQVLARGCPLPSPTESSPMHTHLNMPPLRSTIVCHIPPAAAAVPPMPPRAWAHIDEVPPTPSQAHPHTHARTLARHWLHARLFGREGWPSLVPCSLCMKCNNLCSSLRSANVTD